MAEAMIERVAAAINDAIGTSDRYDAKVCARAAIAAMRVPTRAMYDAGVNAEDSGMAPATPFIWPAMIDAALGETDG